MIWEFPLALVSFLFHGLVKTFMRAVLVLHDSRNKREAQKWIVLSKDDMLARPGALPLIMTTAPRWNTHAILATLSPVLVNNYVEIETAAAERSAGSWTIVVGTYPEHRTVTSVGSLSSGLTSAKTRIDLPSGKYWFALRYYEWHAKVELPAVDADGRRVAATQPVSVTTNDFYVDLHKHSGLFNLALHYYVFVLLRYRTSFPESFVKREFLPVGNPETEFIFGALRKGEELRGHIAPQALGGWSVLLTVYNRASFPIRSDDLKTSELKFTAPADCMYLFRVNRKARGEAVFEKDWIQLQIK